jgi:hypothetical protein
MDSKAVDAALRRQLRPVLRAAGFSRLTARTAWRYAGTRIDVVTFPSFSSHLAESLGCTTYSFSLRLGCTFTEIPPRAEIPLKGDLPVPREYDCELRRTLFRSFEQAELPRRDIWYVDPAGAYVEQAAADAAAVLAGAGLPWFDRFADPGELLRTLLEDPSDMQATWGMGNFGSPVRAYLLGYTALLLGDRPLAREQLAWAAVNWEGFGVDRLRADLEALGDQPPTGRDDDAARFVSGSQR